MEFQVLFVVILMNYDNKKINKNVTIKLTDGAERINMQNEVIRQGGDDQSNELSFELQELADLAGKQESNLEEMERKQNLVKFVNFLDNDLAVKDIMYDIAPSEIDEYSGDGAVDYSDKLYKGFDKIRSLLLRMMETYYPSEQLKNRLDEIKKDTIEAGADFSRLKSVYQSDIADMQSDFVDDVVDKVFGYDESREEKAHNLDEKAHSVNEILHLIHSYVTRNEDIWEGLPIIESNPENFNRLYGDADAKNMIAEKLYHSLNESGEFFFTLIIALKERTLLMVRDYGHATMIDVARTSDGSFGVNYHISKVCDIEKVNALPGVKKVASLSGATTGSFHIDNEQDVPATVFKLISDIPDDLSMPIR